MSNEPLTFEEHRDLGQELLKTQKHLLQLSRMVAAVYGPNNRSVFAFEHLNAAMERLRVELGRQSDADCPGKNAESLYHE